MDTALSEKRPFGRELVLSLVLLTIIGFIDYITSYELQFFVFYFVPIAILAWVGREIPSLCFAVLCAIIWYTVDVGTGHPYTWKFYLYWNTLLRFAAFVTLTYAVLRIRWHVDREKELHAELQAALEREVKDLETLLPVCPTCKKIKNEKGQWQDIEAYVRERSKVVFSHSVCPDCFAESYPEYQADKPA